jgi:hypothetical protein
VNTYLRHAFDLMIEGLLTQLPAQLITAAVAATAATWMRAWRKSRTRAMETQADSGAGSSPFGIARLVKAPVSRAIVWGSIAALSVMTLCVAVLAIVVPMVT